MEMTDLRTLYGDRHPSTLHMMTMLQVNPKLPGIQKNIAGDCLDLADTIVANMPDSPELTAGLRKLLEAKDCFVRASLDLNPVDYRDR
jgi:hypothetical protein